MLTNRKTPEHILALQNTACGPLGCHWENADDNNNYIDGKNRINMEMCGNELSVDGGKGLKREYTRMRLYLNNMATVFYLLCSYFISCYHLPLSVK